MHWLRRNFIAGFFVMVPLIVSVAALVWAFQLIDGFMAPLYSSWLGREVPGLGLVTTLAIVFGVGVLTTNVFGQRLLRRGESYLLKLPVFRVIYAPVKQLVAAFSPENELAFKRVVLIKDPQAGFIFGFLTKEFTLDRRGGCEPVLAVYVPTNHLYLGDVRVFPKNWASYPDLTVQEGVRIFLTGGMAFTAALRVARSVGEAAPALEAARPRPDMAKPDWSRPSGSVRTSQWLLWASRRPTGQARGARIPGGFDQRATQRSGMHRCPDATVLPNRGTMSARQRRPVIDSLSAFSGSGATTQGWEWTTHSTFFWGLARRLEPRSSRLV